MYDDKEKKYFLIVSNNISDEQQIELKISELPVALKSLDISEPHDERELQLKDLGDGSYQFSDTLVNHDIAIYVMESK